VLWVNLQSVSNHNAVSVKLRLASMGPRALPPYTHYFWLSI